MTISVLETAIDMGPLQYIVNSKMGLNYITESKVREFKHL